MFFYELLAVFIYVLVLLGIGLFSSYKKQLSAADFIIGRRSLNYWLTALAAHASDMSNWLFMAYPGIIFAGGLTNAWTAIGLIFFMFLNWQLIAPKIRVATEQYNSLTFSSYFESRFADSSGLIRLFTAIMQLFFYTIYISSALVALGFLLETFFQINYYIGIFLGIFLVIPYVFIGGYLTLAWIDLFQGFFLLSVIVFIPLYLLPSAGGWQAIGEILKDKNCSLLPDFSSHTLWATFSMAAGWGLGYFGQPHIVTKFMGIKNVSEIPKSKWIGITWMTLSLSAATLVGLVGMAYFSSREAGSIQQELVFIKLVTENFHPFFIGFILCAILATSINAMSSQALVLSSSLTEDFYKKIFRKNASSKELLITSRLGIIFVALIAFCIAYGKISSIYSLVFYAWAGLGASFGPLLLASLYSKRINKYGAWAGILSGGILAGIWPYFNETVPALLPAFTVGLMAIFLTSYMTNHLTRRVS